MWKESYQIGVDSIDTQHKALFEMVEKLMNIVGGEQWDEARAESVRAVAFLKGYVVNHFADEEAYQLKIGYKDREAHRRIHQGFVRTVLEAERRMAESDFAQPVLKQFVGTLTTWLIYHVAGEDRKYVDLVKPKAPSQAKTYQESFAESMRSVFATLTGAQVVGVEQGLPASDDGLYVNVGLLGRREGNATFVFPRETAFSIIRAMTFMDVDTVDEMVESALCEVSNIISGNAASVLADAGIECDITTPDFGEQFKPRNADRSLRFLTGLGDIGVSVELR
ncbi:bacteriohemerythrin [Bacillota bacterium Meth-B3]